VVSFSPSSDRRTDLDQAIIGDRLEPEIALCRLEPSLTGGSFGRMGGVRLPDEGGDVVRGRGVPK
jgi:hypothetical protein